jgi:hypothetical protein
MGGRQRWSSGQQGLHSQSSGKCSCNSECNAATVHFMPAFDDSLSAISLIDRGPAVQHPPTHTPTRFHARPPPSAHRYITERIDDLPPSITSRLMQMHNTPLAMAGLLGQRPWAKQAADGRGQGAAFSNGMLQRADADDQQHVGQVEAQVCGCCDPCYAL